MSTPGATRGCPRRLLLLIVQGGVDQPSMPPSMDHGGVASHEDNLWEATSDPGRSLRCE